MAKTKIILTDGNDDWYSFVDTPYEIHAGAGDDRITLKDDSTGDDLIYAGAGNDIVKSGGGFDIVDGGAGNDELWAFGRGSISGGDGNDHIIVSGESFFLFGGAGGDDISSSADQAWIHAGDGNDRVFTNGAGAVWGDEGDDLLMFGVDDNVVVQAFGGVGNDYYRDVGGDTTVDVREDVGAGTDTVEVLLGVDYTLPDNVENLVISTYVYGASIDPTDFETPAGGGTVAGNALDNVITGAQRDETFWGNGGRDTIDGGAGKDVLHGGDGGDTLDGGADTVADALYGEAGNDRLVGHGYDKLTGGTGDDTYVVTATDQIVEQAGQGTDTVETTLGGYTLATNLEKLVFTNAAISTIGFGNAAANTLVGADGISRLYGMDGNDLIKGNGGADYLYGGNGADVIYGGTGNDQIWGDAGLDQLLGGDGNDIVHGGADADKIWGEAGDDQLYGDAGNDTVNGGDGADKLWGGADDDTLYGGTGNDTLYGEAGNDVLWGEAGDDRLYAGAANDTLKGGDGNDILDGGANDDLMIGGNGNDLYYVDSYADWVVESAGGGTDEVRTMLSSWILGAEVENLSALSTDDFHGIGNALNNRIEGEDGNDYLEGLAGNDTLIGGVGDDLLKGGDGNDTLAGGVGQDTLIGGTGFDTVDYSGNAAGGITIDLAAQTVTGGEATGDTISGIEAVIGSKFNDTIRGSAGAETISGGAGNDQIYGSAGADWIDGGTGTGDTVHYTASSAAVTIDLVNNLCHGGDAEGDTLIAVENVVASKYDDHVNGDAANNSLYGMDGNDWMWGGAGNDYLYGGNGDDALSGDAGKDVIYGGAGKDHIWGGAGDDILWGEAGADTFDLGGNAGNDRIGDFTDGEDKIRAIASSWQHVHVAATVDGAVITVDGVDGSLLLAGVDAAKITAADFLFA
jgi:Ca2+-binding RTX toxin-like protein